MALAVISLCGGTFFHGISAFPNANEVHAKRSNVEASVFGIPFTATTCNTLDKKLSAAGFSLSTTDRNS